MANALVLGMGGVGCVIGKKLHGYDSFDRIFLADIDTTFAEKLHQGTKRSRFQVMQLNAMNVENLIQFIREYKIEVVLNACPCVANHSILEACVEGGSHYLDMAADIYSAPGVKSLDKNSFEAEIEMFHDRFLDRGLAGILCMGCDPGAVNIFARWAMDRLDTASSIRVLDADNAQVKGFRFAVLFNPETLFEELGAVPYYVEDGRIVAGEPLATEVDFVKFPEPIGLVKTYAVAHEEAVSLGTYPPFVEKGVKYSVFKYSLSDEVYHVAKVLSLLNLNTWKKITVDGVQVSPVRVAAANLPKPAQLGATVDGYSCVGTEVIGTKDRKRVRYFVYSMDSHRDVYELEGFSLTEVQTGIPPALAARLLIDGELKERGVMMPEALDPEPFMENFTREGLKIFVEKHETERM